MKVKIVKIEQLDEFEKTAETAFECIKNYENEFYNNFGHETNLSQSNFEYLNPNYLYAGSKRGFITVYNLVTEGHIAGSIGVNSKEEILFLFSAVKSMYNEISMLLFRYFLLNVLEKTGGNGIIYTSALLSQVEMFLKLGFTKASKVEIDSKNKLNFVKMTYNYGQSDNQNS